MNRLHGAHRATARSLALVAIASLFAGCSGTSPLLPMGPALTGAVSSSKEASGERIAVRMQIRIPRRHKDDARSMHPATISSMTNSIAIAVNGGAQQIFNTTAVSPNCTVGAGGRVCTFSVVAKTGTDTFAVTTYSSVGGGGTALDHGIATVPIAKGKANAVAVRLGPVVTTVADSGIGSLRYAVGSANAGDTIMFMLPAGSRIALASPIVILGTVTLAGPGAASIAISGGNLTQLFNVQGTATISGLTLTQGNAAVASKPGGTIWNVGTLTLVNDTIGASTSSVMIKRAHGEHVGPSLRRRPHCTTTYVYGGGLYNNGSLTISGTTFNGNVVKSDVASCLSGEGGAIYNDVGGTITSTADTFTNNSAIAGGAVYNASLGQVEFTGDTFASNTGCTATSGCPTSCTSTMCTSAATGQGAAIFDAGSGVVIASSTFANNVAGGLSSGSVGAGGALALTTGSPTVTGSVFTGNLAGGGSASCAMGSGGAIASAAPNLTLNNDTFTSNRAVGDDVGDGGAIFSTTSVVQGTNDTFKTNAAVGYGSACTPSSMSGGGAIFDVASVTLSNSTFTGNTASGNAQGAAGAVACGTCSLSADSFVSNSATGTGAQSAPAVGGGAGAVYMQAGGQITGCTFTSNSVTAEGPNAQALFGGAVAAQSGTFTSSHNTFTSNALTQLAGTGSDLGGGIAVIAGTMFSSGDVFKSNTITSGNIAGGGGAYVAGGYTMTGATFSGNRIAGKEGAGGGLAVGAAGELTNSTFVGNAAVGTSTIGAGGGIYDMSGSTLLGDTISQNTASTNGGGIYSQSAEVVVQTTITGNTVTKAAAAHSGGGGIFGSAIFEWSTISNNTVTVSGVGGSGGGGVLNATGMEMLQSTISGNAVLGNAPSSGGGGIYSGSTMILLNDTISGNSSKLDGGGIEIASSNPVTLSDATVFANTAIGSGGNIDNLFSTTVTNSIIAGGVAASGGDVKNTGTFQSGDYNIIQTPVVGTPISGTTTHNLAVNPQLLPLSNNGGPTFTNADQFTSPGRGHIPFSGTTCGTATEPIDQRGYARGAGGFCDVGAFEYGGVPTSARHRLPRLTGFKLASPVGPPLLPMRVRPLQL